MESVGSIIYILLPPILVAVLFFKKDLITDNIDLGIKQDWNLIDILMVISCLALLQILATFIGQQKIVTYYNLFIYGTFISIGLLGILLYLILKYKYKANCIVMGLSKNKLVVNIVIGVSCFLLYELFILFVSFLIDLENSYLNKAQFFIKIQLHQLPVFDLFIYISGLTILAPIVEECLFRGFMFGPFKRKVGEAGSICLTSIIWSITHLQTNSFLNLFIVGVFLCYLFKKTASLIPGIVMHSMMNISNLLIYAYLIKIDNG